MAPPRSPISHTFRIDFTLEGDDAGGDDRRKEWDATVTDARRASVREIRAAFVQFAISAQHVRGAEAALRIDVVHFTKRGERALESGSAKAGTQSDFATNVFQAMQSSLW